jgi:hypothetical protein
MVWIKRNLFFVIALAVAVALTGYCGYLLYSSLSANAAVRDEYDSTLSQLTTLEQSAPYPSKENIDAADADKERVRQFLGDFRKSFAPFPVPPAENQQGFQTYLEETLVRFRSEATNAGVQIPPDFGFTFSGLHGKLTVPQGNIGPWMEQLTEIGAILDILYHAKINALVSLCRVPVSQDDVGTGDCMLATTSTTNVWGVVTPYKFTFHGFSAEIASVLDGFARSSNCFIIETVEVTADKTALPTPSAAGAMPTAPTYRQVLVPQANPGFSSSRERGQPGALRPMPPRYTTVLVPNSTAPTASTGPETILSEDPLLVTMTVEAVKLKVSEH